MNPLFRITPNVPRSSLPEPRSLLRRRALLMGTSSMTALSCAALLAACAAPSGPAAGARSLAVQIEAAGDINPDARGRASPLVLRLYELDSTSAFMSSDFLSLFERDQATLGSALVSRDEWTVTPGQKLELQRPLQGRTRHLGAVAAFRDLERSVWRAAIDPAALGSSGLRLRLSGRMLRLESR